MTEGTHRVERGSFTNDGLRLSYLDSGETDRPVLLALHGHLNEGRFVDQGALPPGHGYRVIAPDQRGHGESDHANPDGGYATDRYVDDALALLNLLEVDQAVVLGHSLGGAVTYCLAARAPERVRAMVVVDIAACIDDSLDLVTAWPRRAPTREALVDAFGFMGPKQEFVMREYDDGWGVPWHREGMPQSQRELNGDRWDQWLATDLPTLLVHGTDSRQLATAHAEDMARRRPNTELVHLPGGHAMYVDHPEEYAAAVSPFLARFVTAP